MESSFPKVFLFSDITSIIGMKRTVGGKNFTKRRERDSQFSLLQYILYIYTKKLKCKNERRKLISESLLEIN